MTRPPLRITMFSDSYLPRISGVVHSLEATTRGLRALGHRVLVAAPRHPGYVDADPDVVRFPSIRPPRQPDFPLALPYSPRAWRRLEEEAPDVVHTHTPFVMGAAGARLARRARAPLVFTHHTLYDEYVHYAPFVSRAVSAPAVRAYVTRYANRCQAVIVPTRVMEARLRELGVHARIARISTGTLDAAQLAALDPGRVRPAFGLPPARALLVTASRLGREKSVDLVLAAFARVRGTHEATLLVVGGGPEEDALRALAQALGVAGDVVFTGLLPHPRALECVAAADLFLYASQTETQGMVVIEAMALGLPVVAVHAGGIPDAVREGETGFLTPPDAEALAARVRALLDDPARRRTMGEAGRAASGAYALPAVTAQLVSLYESLLPEARGPIGSREDARCT